MNCPPLHLQPSVHLISCGRMVARASTAYLLFPLLSFYRPMAKYEVLAGRTPVYIYHTFQLLHNQIRHHGHGSVTVREHLFAGGTHFSFTYCVGMMKGEGGRGVPHEVFYIMAATAHACTHKMCLEWGEKEWGEGLDEGFRVCFRKTPSVIRIILIHLNY